ncbi:MAG: hypothetical protein M3Q23_13390 [Actinomycetota bacterium]|nr:hypothetical protein [Actinomycetota bacterium]
MAEPNGKRRIDRIQGPGYAEDLERLPLDEVRRRRDECLAEREYQSLLRRLLQGRLDILSAHLDHRRAGDVEPFGPDDESIVQELAHSMAPPGGGSGSRGEVLRLLVPPEEMSLARRRVESLIADPAISDPRALSDDDLAEVVDRLRSEEQGVSADRAAVIEAHDRLQAELRRRYRDDPSLIVT